MKKGEDYRFDLSHLKIRYQRGNTVKLSSKTIFPTSATGLQGRGVLPLFVVAPHRWKPTYSREILTFPLVPNRIARFTLPRTFLRTLNNVTRSSVVDLGRSPSAKEIIVNPLPPFEICQRVPGFKSTSKLLSLMDAIDCIRIVT